MQLFATTAGVIRRTADVYELVEESPDSLATALISGSLDALIAAPTLRPVALDTLTMLPPLQPKRVIVIGLNYRSHADEVGVPVPEALMFVPTENVATAVVGSGAAIVLPADHPTQVDYEAEIAIIIGREAHDLTAESAWDAVVAITAANDITARDLQMSLLPTGDYTTAKLLPTFKPLGPGVITVDEARRGLLVRSLVNGEVRQDATDSDMVFSIPEIVATLSTLLGLHPGDVIITGSPAGVGTANGRFLSAGDIIEVIVGDLPPLRNPVTTG